MENSDLIDEIEYLKNLLSRVTQQFDTASITDDDLISELNSVLGENEW